MSADRTHRNAEIERSFVLFRRFGAAPCGELYLAFFDPEATLFDSGMVEYDGALVFRRGEALYESPIQRVRIRRCRRNPHLSPIITIIIIV